MRSAIHVGPSVVVLFALVLIFFFAANSSASDLEEVAVLTPSDAELNQRFAHSVSLDGDVAVVGASLDSDDGADSGSTYAYRYDGGAWIEEDELSPSDGAAGDLFGVSVSLDGDRTLIGAKGDDGKGSAYVFEFDGSTWAEEHKLTASDGIVRDAFGSSVSLDGDVALIGAPGGGAAYVFRFDGTTWVEEQMLTPSDGATQFGTRVSVDGDVALIGSPSGGSGTAYVFRFDGTTWVEEQILTGGGSQFGHGLSVLGDVAVVGAYCADDCTGAAYVYRFDGMAWTLEQKLVPDGGEAGDAFGWSISLNDGVVLVGALFDEGVEATSGSAYVFRFDGTTWVEELKLIANDGASLDHFGWEVSLDGDTALIAAPNASLGGSAHVFFGASCKTGTVNLAEGPVADVLFLDGSTGGPDRTVDVSAGSSFTVTLQKPPAGGNGKFVLHADEGEATLLTQTVLPFGVGTSCFPFLLTEGATPVIIANNIGKTGAVGESEVFGDPADDPPPATTTLPYADLPLGTVLTFQALIVDPASVGTKNVSATNAVTLVVVP